MYPTQYIMSYIQRGHFEAEKVYRRLIKDSKPFGSIQPTIINIDIYGFIAIVYTLESIQAGSELRTFRKKGTPAYKPPKVEY